MFCKIFFSFKLDLFWKTTLDFWGKKCYIDITKQIIFGHKFYETIFDLFVLSPLSTVYKEALRRDVAATKLTAPASLFTQVDCSHKKC